MVSNHDADWRQQDKVNNWRLLKLGFGAILIVAGTKTLFSSLGGVVAFILVFAMLVMGAKLVWRYQHEVGEGND